MYQHRIYFILFILILISNNIVGQSIKIKLSGNNKLPVEKAIITDTLSGETCATNDFGVAFISSSVKNVRISHVNYRDTFIHIIGLNERDIILKEKDSFLSPINIYSHNLINVFSLPSYSGKAANYYLAMPNCQWVSKFEMNLDSNFSYRLQSLQIEIRNKKELQNINGFIEIRLYGIEKNSGNSFALHKEALVKAIKDLQKKNIIQLHNPILFNPNLFSAFVFSIWVQLPFGKHILLNTYSIPFNENNCISNFASPKSGIDTILNKMKENESFFCKKEIAIGERLLRPKYSYMIKLKTELKKYK